MTRKNMLDIREKMCQVFKIKRVADMQILQEELNNRSTRSIFRDLESEGYFSSFSHSGKYYTLKNIPNFNLEGFWFHQGIGFAKYGTLKNTLIHLIENSNAGKTHDELKKQLHIRVQNTLLDLVQANKITRRKIEGYYVYFTINSNFANKQILSREKYNSVSEPIDYPDWMMIEILASIIRTSEVEKIELSKIVSDLASRKIIISAGQIEQVLNKFNLKKILE
jgi:hypothetical protein